MHAAFFVLAPVVIVAMLLAGCGKGPVGASGLTPASQLAVQARKRKDQLPQHSVVIPPRATPMKVFKKPIPVEAEQLTEARTVQTQEGPVAANAGDWLMTGVKGEQWPISPAKFQATYGPVDGKPGYYAKKTIVVTAVTLSEPMIVKTSWGAELQGKPGDWLVAASPDDRWIVESQIFQETYALAE